MIWEFIKKKKASETWTDAFSSIRSIEKDSPSDGTLTMSVGGNVRHDSMPKVIRKIK